MRLFRGGSSQGGSRPKTTTNHRWLTGVVVVLIAATGVLLLVLWPREQPSFDPRDLGFATSVTLAEVTATSDGTCTFAEHLECRIVEFTIVAGPDSGLSVRQQFELSSFTPAFDVGEGVVLNVVDYPDIGTVFEYSDKDRRPVLVMLLLLFSLAVVALGRFRGLAALGGLVVSVAVLGVFIAPSILAGNDPVLVATVGGAAIALIAIYAVHGWSPITHVAVLGTFSALALTLGLTWMVAALADFSGFAADEAVFVSLVETVDVSGLILAGAVLGAIGALDDITVTQASTVLELHGIGGEASTADIYRRGIRVGRDHIAAVVNTLFLAYVGAALPLILLFSLSSVRFDLIANSEQIAVEIVRTMVGSIGLVAAVPITTWMAAWVVTRRRHGDLASSS
jgi:uncharacterized membrane protein